MIEGGQNLAPNVPNQPPAPANKKENALKGFIDSDLKNLADIAGLKNKEDIRQAIKRHIDSILEDYKNSKRTDEDFSLITKRLEVLSIGGSFTKLDSYDVDRSWDQDQVDFFIGKFNERAKGNREFYEETLANPFLFSSAFTTSSKNKKEQNTISELVARSAIKIIKSGETLSDALSKELEIWFQNIQMVDMDVRLDMISAFLHNPGQVDRNLTSEMIANQGLYGPALPQQLEGLLQKNKQNTNRVLKIVEVLEKLYRIDWAGFEDSSEEAGRALQRIAQNSDNYFLKFKLDAVGGRYDLKQRDKTRKLLKEYDQPDLRSTGPIPLERRGWYDQDKFVEKCSYSKVSNKYGVIYNPFDGGIDSFFEIGSPKKENLRLEDIIAREGMSFFADMKPDEQENLINNYKSLMAVDFRNRIEDEFGIEMSSFDIREQLQFVNFLSTKTTREVENVKQFLNQGQTNESKIHRIKSFLSLEFGGEMGERILNIGRSLENQPQAADQLFAEYFRMIDEAEKDAGKVCKIYEDIFPDKRLSRNQVIEAILRKGKDLLSEASDNLQTTDPSKRSGIITEVIANIKRQQIAQKNEINELKEIGLNINSQYSEIFPKAPATEEGKTATLSPWIEEALKRSEERKNKFDVERIRDLIASYEGMYILSEFQEGIHRWSEGMNDEQIAELKQYMEKYERPRYEPIVAKLKKLLPYQANFERKLEQIILGQEAATLPKKLLADLSIEALEPGKENIPSREPLYFPVGISKDLPAWERFFNGEMKVAKPIDAYGYLFWLNNQGRKAELVVCDEIQKSNYQVLYGKTEQEASEASQKIGAEEKNFYKKLIKTFGLKNISVVNYRNFKERVGYRFQKYQTLCQELSQNQSMRNAFLSMVPESVGSSQDRERQLPYAIEELSWILANDGTKVSHLNEARYDAIAAVIKNTESFLQRKRIDISSFPNGQGLLPFILESAQALRNLANEKKSRAEKDSAEFNYWKNIYDCLGQIRRPAGIKIKPVKEMGKRETEFNFLCPPVSAQSFGLEDIGGMRKSNVLKFKEPYSTYFVNREGVDLFLDSDQVVAAPEGNIGGKILTLSEGNQRKYAEKVLKPLLVQFFKDS